MTILTLISYEYRDAANYKIEHEVIIRGRLCYHDIKPYLTVASCFIPQVGSEDFLYFIPSQVGLEDLQTHMPGFPDLDLDHVWHRIIWVRQTDKKHSTEITANELKANFICVAWDENAAMEKLGMWEIIYAI